VIQYPTKKNLLHFVEAETDSVDEEICHALQITNCGEYVIQMFTICPTTALIQRPQFHLFEKHATTL